MNDVWTGALTKPSEKTEGKHPTQKPEYLLERIILASTEEGQVGGLAGADSVEYYVQAKRNKPGTTIPIEKVRALRGVMSSGSKGIFVTTARYSKKRRNLQMQIRHVLLY